jgi:hypothetical protein
MSETPMPMTDLDMILREIEENDLWLAGPRIVVGDWDDHPLAQAYRCWLRDRANLKRAVLALKAARLRLKIIETGISATVTPEATAEKFRAYARVALTESDDALSSFKAQP